MTLLFHSKSRSTGHISRYETVRDYGEYADAAEYGQTLSNEVWYRENLPSGAAAPSIVVPVEPGPNISNINGIWGIVTAMSDETTIPGTREVLEVSLYVLAEASDYASRSDVEDDLSPDFV